jgi:hypothetical protein
MASRLGESSGGRESPKGSLREVLKLWFLERGLQNYP